MARRRKRQPGHVNAIQQILSRYDAVADPRIARLDERVSLAGKHILELGSFCGGHTLAMCRRAAAEVVGLDVRPQNLVVAMQTRKRHISEMQQARFKHYDVRNLRAVDWPGFDLVLCIGVLYHLLRPDMLLRELGRLAPHTYLWTHFATESQPHGEWTSIGGAFGPMTGKWWPESDGPISACDRMSFWLRYDELLRLIAASGMSAAEVQVLAPNPQYGQLSTAELLLTRP